MQGCFPQDLPALVHTTIANCSGHTWSSGEPAGPQCPTFCAHSPGMPCLFCSANLPSDSLTHLTPAHHPVGPSDLPRCSGTPSAGPCLAQHGCPAHSSSPCYKESCLSGMVSGWRGAGPSLLPRSCVQTTSLPCSFNIISLAPEHLSTARCPLLFSGPLAHCCPLHHKPW